MNKKEKGLMNKSENMKEEALEVDKFLFNGKMKSRSEILLELSKTNLVLKTR